ncbi:hypothetical protein GCM10012275_28110 [Longimycelium tulufanense]|uniref:Uncharacterized protein n=1 Tax=Longimycelium tulufanense TaxID=907463 RepID=A0A8J3CEG4_9PSEU|nr:hypothetical protein [Longimycelium tulufanense]GGM55336.1 hypothetical protein GCM10012275_28110 [Longimycelium tulufanense]
MIHLLMLGTVLALTGVVWIYLSYHYASGSPSGRHAPESGRVPAHRLIRRYGRRYGLRVVA